MFKNSIAIAFFVMMIICHVEAQTFGPVPESQAIPYHFVEILPKATCSGLYDDIQDGTADKLSCTESTPMKISKIQGGNQGSSSRSRNDMKAAKVKSQSGSGRKSNPSKGNVSNVILSEPVSCTHGTDPLGVCALQAQNYTGKGISVAIIDYEYYINRLSERELPRDRIELFDDSFYEDECHGIACAEVIGDIAPNVTLYLVGLEEQSQAGFIEAVEKLNRLDKRIDIVSCSIDFTFGLFDESGDICNATRNLTRNGTIWFTAAGDSARKHWRGTFKDLDKNGFNEFGPADESLNLTAERGDMLVAWLSWNESWSRAQADYDLYLFSPDGTYAISDDPQEGYDGQEPAELVTMVAPVSGNYSLKIRKYGTSADAVSFQLFASNDLLKYNTTSSSLGPLASCADVITVGAVDRETLKLENYSSMGPTTDGRMKPELMAPDNITVSSYLPEKFKGSSASAPYAAGIFALALEKGRKMGLEDKEILQLLFDSAIDLGPEGPENEYGYGLVNLNGFAELQQKDLRK